MMAVDAKAVEEQDVLLHTSSAPFSDKVLPNCP